MTIIASEPLVRVRMSHMKDIPLYQQEVPYEIWCEDVEPNVQRTNIELEIINDVNLIDVRKLESEKPSLESHGFEYLYQKFPERCGIKSADDIGASSPGQRQKISDYLECLTELLHDRYGCTKVLCFDWRVRRVVGGIQPEAPNIYSLKDLDEEEPRAATINAAHVIHADGSPRWMKQMIANLLSADERSELMKEKHRIRAITVWRPIVEVVENEPLALCDVQTLKESDWEVVEKIMDDSIEESMYLKRRDYHKWYWMQKQTRDDVLVISVWDSDQPDNPNVSVPHCAVMLPGQTIESNPRESIEMRFLIFTKT